ncbi:hypothetical protein BDP27DRAFT_1316413 [Rhodocollybia butyracea]|uniref:Uncharacterized protein n=1 Tax=Rhodocollybia butyracea TaxID=206335 RepID=A0A9P5Q2Z9_9AGAR|nr:hypothetical protein BDP27DRAFT_1316413 [Rhodocollybia butyracea]
MAEAAGLAGLGAATTLAAKWIGPTSFTARHEENHRKSSDSLQQHITHWYKDIPDLEVESDEEREFQRLQNEYVARENENSYHESIQDYRKTSVFKLVEKIRMRHRVRESKREALRSVHSTEVLVNKVSDRSRAGSRASSRATSEASMESQSMIADRDSPPEVNTQEESISEHQMRSDAVAEERRRRDELRDHYAKLKDVLRTKNIRNFHYSIEVYLSAEYNRTNAAAHIIESEAANRALEDRISAQHRHAEELRHANEQMMQMLDNRGGRDGIDNVVGSSSDQTRVGENMDCS